MERLPDLCGRLSANGAMGAQGNPTPMPGLRGMGESGRGAVCGLSGIRCEFFAKTRKRRARGRAFYMDPSEQGVYSTCMRCKSNALSGKSSITAVYAAEQRLFHLCDGNSPWPHVHSAYTVSRPDMPGLLAGAPTAVAVGAWECRRSNRPCAASRLVSLRIGQLEGKGLAYTKP